MSTQAGGDRQASPVSPEPSKSSAQPPTDDAPLGALESGLKPRHVTLISIAGVGLLLAFTRRNPFMGRHTVVKWSGR